MPQSALERTFETHWIQLGGSHPPPEPEYLFHPYRNWRFDFCWVNHGVAVEIEGGVDSNGRHTRAQGFIDDCEKYNAAAEGGWLVLRFAGRTLKNDPFSVIEQIKRVLDYREREFKNGRSAAIAYLPKATKPKPVRNRAGNVARSSSKPRKTNNRPPRKSGGAFN